MKEELDIDSLRTEHESDEQWAVRKMFMEEHKDKFNETELVTLAQLFTNIEFLGCRYKPDIMKQMAYLCQSTLKKFNLFTPFGLDTDHWSRMFISLKKYRIDWLTPALLQCVSHKRCPCNKLVKKKLKTPFFDLKVKRDSKGRNSDKNMEKSGAYMRTDNSNTSVASLNDVATKFDALKMSVVGHKDSVNTFEDSSENVKKAQTGEAKSETEKADDIVSVKGDGATKKVTNKEKNKKFMKINATQDMPKKAKEKSKMNQKQSVQVSNTNSHNYFDYAILNYKATNRKIYKDKVNKEKEWKSKTVADEIPQNEWTLHPYLTEYSCFVVSKRKSTSSDQKFPEESRNRKFASLSFGRQAYKAIEVKIIEFCQTLGIPESLVAFHGTVADDKLKFTVKDTNLSTFVLPDYAFTLNGQKYFVEPYDRVNAAFKVPNGEIYDCNNVLSWLARQNDHLDLSIADWVYQYEYLLDDFRYVHAEISRDDAITLRDYRNRLCFFDSTVLVRLYPKSNKRLVIHSERTNCNKKINSNQVNPLKQENANVTHNQNTALTKNRETCSNIHLNDVEVNSNADAENALTEEDAPKRFVKAILSLENDRKFEREFQLDFIEYESKKKLHLSKWRLLYRQHKCKAIVSMPERHAMRLLKGKVSLMYAGIKMNVDFPDLIHTS